jgi:hypothetical protein
MVRTTQTISFDFVGFGTWFLKPRPKPKPKDTRKPSSKPKPNPKIFGFKKNPKKYINYCILIQGHFFQLVNYKFS